MNRGLAGLMAGAALAGTAYGATRAGAARLRARPDEHGPDILAPLALANHTIPSHDGGTINYVRIGSGRPIVLSHGVTLSVRTWGYQLRDLPSHGFDVIAFDHRGHGGSVVGDDGHSVETLGDDFRTLLETLDLRDAILVGHSMGGIAVQSFITRHPDAARERVDGIVLLSTLPRAPVGSQSTRARMLAERLTRRTPDTTRIWDSPNLGLVLARIGFGADPQPSHVELVRQMMLECPIETRAAAPRSLIGMDLVDALAKVDVRTLVIGGTDDFITPPRDSRLLASTIPGARLELFPDAGHMIMLERREELARLLVEFAEEAREPAHATSE